MTTIFDFKTAHHAKDWLVINDGVMGGISSGHFHIKNEQATFSGTIALDNNGGFSSVRNRNLNQTTATYSTLVLYLKGDGKRYQIRIKASTAEAHSYVAYFTTSGHWETISIPLQDMAPKFRGRPLELPNFNAPRIEELGFLCANKKAEEFILCIASISIA